MVEPIPQADTAQPARTAGRSPVPPATPVSRQGRLRVILPVLLLLGLGAGAGTALWLRGLPLVVDRAGPASAQPAAPMVPPADGAASAGPPDPALARLEARLAELEARLMAATERPQVMPTTPSLEARIEALDKGQRALAARLQTFERRLASVGLAQGAALAERSQALLLLTAARRHVERGRPLGALEPRVAELFGPRDPSAVAALAAWSRAPVSASLLAERLHEAPLLRPRRGRRAGGRAFGTGCRDWLKCGDGRRQRRPRGRAPRPRWPAGTRQVRWPSSRRCPRPGCRRSGWPTADGWPRPRPRSTAWNSLSLATASRRRAEPLRLGIGVVRPLGGPGS